MVVAPQFAGTVFGLRPDTDHEIELHAQDPDGLDETWTVQARTRPVPGDPQAPNPVAVSDTASLKAALRRGPGRRDHAGRRRVRGPFEISASGTASRPDRDPRDEHGRDGARRGRLRRLQRDRGVRQLRAHRAPDDRGGQPGAALPDGGRAGQRGPAGRVLRDVRLGIGAREDQLDFYICDNELEGRLKWPQVYGDDGGMFANEDGIVVMGTGTWSATTG
jgi:hypothetical protein